MVEEPGNLDDQDIDGLLSTIASAQERIATDYSAEKTVLITDMMSFSEMTEQDGSMNSALTVQKHRNLLLPIIERHGGKGKAAGGDGMIAAFDRPDDAIRCAVDIQRSLDSYNAANPKSRSIKVRIGLASGEIVVDREGTPFIGSALNLAARVMSLAEGGRIFAAGNVLAAAAVPVQVAQQGTFSLKGIPAPTEVYEVLWHGGQAPAQVAEQVTAPASTPAASPGAAQAGTGEQALVRPPYFPFLLKTGLPWAVAMFFATGMMNNTLLNQPVEKMAVRIAAWLVIGALFGSMLWLVGKRKPA
jgi:class 3 adenylate cyclase